jgi:hypothetical protein
MGPQPDQALFRCSFCHRSQFEVRKMVMGESAEIAICDECALDCVDRMGKIEARTEDQYELEFPQLADSDI